MNRPLHALFLCLLLAPAVLNGQAAPPPATQEKAAAAEPPKVKTQYAPEDGLDDEGASNDPFASGHSNGGVVRVPLMRGKENRAALTVRVEVWEIATKEMAVKLDGIRDSKALEAWRAQWIGDNTSLLVHAPVIALDEKSRMSGESILERIYPTEYEPPELPSSAGLKATDEDKGEWDRWLKAAGKYAVPTAFDTRNTGETLELVAQPVAADRDAWDLAVSFESVELAGKDTYGAADLLIKMPAFSAFRTGGIVRVKVSQWRILSALEAPRGVDGKSTGKSWLTLVRADVAN